MNRWLSKIIDILSLEDAEMYLSIQTKGRILDLWIDQGQLKKIYGCKPDELSHLLLDPDACVMIRKSPKLNMVQEVNFSLEALLKGAEEKDVELQKNRTIVVPREMIEKLRAEARGDAVAMHDTKVSPVSSVSPISQPSPKKVVLHLQGTITDFWIGRDPGCNISLTDGRSSRRHCRIFSVGTSYFLEDNNSTNGTYVNGNKVQTTGINQGDLIRLGDNLFEVHIEATEQPKPLKAKLLSEVESSIHHVTQPMSAMSA